MLRQCGLYRPFFVRTTRGHLRILSDSFNRRKLWNFRDNGYDFSPTLLLPSRFPPPSSCKAAESRYLIYKDAVVDHFNILLSSLEGSTTKTPLRDALESCLPSFSNLRMAGLRNYHGHQEDETKRFPRIMRGIGSLRTQLGFNLVYPSSLTRGADKCARTTLGTTHTRIERLETSGGMMVDDELDLTPAEEEALTPILQRLQHLSVRISSAHTQDSERQHLREDKEEVAFLLQESVVWQERKNLPEREKKRLLPLFVQAAPSLESLDLTMHLAGINPSLFCRQKAGLDLTDAHLDWISQQFKFSRLSVLSLS
ncbi:hypothetical protein DTO013E5_3301 [Penicillium roqueforti]|uniref:uncharacterized protein n=1 Tax=Penicillium roqueforti TaxID=5082 RepID=UPI00190C8B95|nr:uncharacterized protein LCP9604111_5931 [Penicillium roqueforti]KAF9247741.1 hypothetical protein LCP9604111_5931 [Penicillium roqueforti]KAI1837066.1 hypothetical protein CBS147337_2318 [Penicillium roqueforti]KAI2678122.1 hypothetical protein CBS147355_5123 [Penicillium roqueforti]KAI2686529.1 hypothetical protein LCP963914a_4129 [Penicillium roqueforti]KAI2704485.1 hypothetical protein CBS147372_2954 [Penicillium roqueforti]